MNKAFNKFVAKYQCAYQGPNTLKGQIDANVKKAAKTSKEDFDFKLSLLRGFVSQNTVTVTSLMERWVDQDVSAYP